jgi:hypothetical protein
LQHVSDLANGTYEEFLAKVVTPGYKVEDRRDARKLRLFACACCRNGWELLPDGARKAVEVGERLADEGLPKESLSSVEGAAYAAVPVSIWITEYHPHQAGRWAVAAHLDDVLGYTPKCMTAGRTGKQAQVDEEREQCNLLRDIYGNPYRLVSFSASWRSDTALSLARQMYESRDFGAMPILADALQDAGCEDPAILDHCRDANQPHVRGCWVVDLVLGKE